MYTRKEVINRDYHACLNFIDKIDQQLFTIRNWTIVSISALVAFAFHEKQGWIAFIGAPLTLFFLFLELVYKSFQDDVIELTTEIDERIQGTWNASTDDSIWGDYKVGMGRALKRPSFGKIWRALVHKDKIHIRCMYLGIALLSAAAGVIILYL